MIVDGHGCHTALHFGVKAKENQDKVPTLYWLPKLHKKPYIVGEPKSRIVQKHTFFAPERYMAGILYNDSLNGA